MKSNCNRWKKAGHFATQCFAAKPQINVVRGTIKEIESFELNSQADVSRFAWVVNSSNKVPNKDSSVLDS
ncbi:hypothetical protein CANINC_004438 [Pichia inconspicua]|uniref:Uncharacterized protein n=1 Tax=Pichia inconspicua TaxID=52247 RepID=A0A4T0WVA1_9ASCO|nr:hypothetical protein CANINC_004438 [[Candida] inconspicua]